jgi:thiol-disulfide isomerase/thioredoxin
MTLKNVIVGLLLCGASLCASAAGWKVGDALPDLGGFKLEGKLPADLRGKVILVDFWASWCGPCKQSFPALNDLQKQFADKGVVIVAINVDESRSDMEAFLKQHPAAFTVVRDVSQKLVEKAGVETMPSSFLVGADGRIRAVHSGFKGEDTRKKYIEEITALLKP